MKDQLVDCKRCGGNACYEQHIDEQTTTWLCMGCGFTTSTIMTEGSQPLAEIKDTSPELYKDLLYKDDNGRYWAPATITLPAKGMVFLDGKTVKDWKWSAVKATPLTKEDLATGRYPKGQTHKMDMQTAKMFDQKGFMDALEVIGFYDVN